MESRLLRMEEVARVLDVSMARAYELAREGLLPIVRIGRQVRVDTVALESWIQKGGQPLEGG
jgi:excisionase family DNA binding protein